jgi:pimeloyl-ACP methyl ester carboxylesterase
MQPVRGGVALPWFAGMLIAMRVLAVFGRGGTALVRLLRRLGLLPLLAAPLLAAAVHPSVVSALGDEVRPAAFAHAARLAAAYDERAWTTVTCPVHSVRGIRDVFAGEADAAAFVRAIPRFRETRLPDAGHFAHIEQPHAVLAALRAVTPTRRSPNPHAARRDHTLRAARRVDSLR